MTPRKYSRLIIDHRTLLKKTDGAFMMRCVTTESNIIAFNLLLTIVQRNEYQRMFTTLTIENKELRWKVSNVNEQYDVSGSGLVT